MTAEFRFSNSSLENRKGVVDELAEISDLALRLSRIDFGIPRTGGVRTAKEQYGLYCAGKSNCDGYEIKSRHQFGTALDFFAYVDGAASWQPEHLAQVAAALLQAANELGYRLEWGGLWESFQDMPHVELAD